MILYPIFLRYQADPVFSNNLSQPLLLGTDHNSFYNVNPIHINQNEADIFTKCSEPGSSTYIRDFLTSVDDPKFIDIQEADKEISDNDLIIGVEVDGQMRGYPHTILRIHEVVNDKTVGRSVTYCPLTGSGIVYNSNQLGNAEIGVTGLLFESNLIFYDRFADSCFSQMLNLGVSGYHSGLQLEFEPTIETSWATWKTLYPESVVLSREIVGSTHSRYDRNPYSGYETDGSLYYPVNQLSDEPYNLFDIKEKTLLVISDSDVFLFPYSELAKNTITNHDINYQEFVVAYDEDNNLAVSFYSNHSDQIKLTFELVTDKSNLSVDQTFGMNVFRDIETGSIWNMKGESIAGSLSGTKLKQFTSFSAYWFASIVFYPNSFIFIENNPIQYDITPELDQIVVPGEDRSFDVMFITIIFASLVLVIYILKKTK